jgi:hypothetical protein
MNKCALLLLLAFGGLCHGQTTPKAFRATIEATELDRRMLLEKLNTHGQGHHMKFELADSEYDYRIVFSTEQGTTATTWGELNSSIASADVFDATGTELFRFDRKGRGSDRAATSAVAKEIIKRILALNKLH